MSVIADYDRGDCQPAKIVALLILAHIKEKFTFSSIKQKLLAFKKC